MVAELVSAVPPYQVLPFPRSTESPGAEASWAAMESIVDLLIDWDLMTVEITVAELEEWLEAPRSLCEAALDQLRRLPGARVAYPDPVRRLVMIQIDADVCPLTAAP
jgi:hypothetical protein